MKIVIPSRKLSATHISTLMRVIQATMREIAGQEVNYETDSYPVLHCETNVEDDTGALVYEFMFVDKHTGSAIEEYTNQVGENLVDEVVKYMNGNSQASLWGFSVIDRNKYKDQPISRLEKLRRELNKYPGTYIEHDGRVVEFNGESFNFKV
tara:strand:+ start:2223 stop:2678 length:456 start_codon:yes stop_codon:yes gene_type:complete